MSPLRRVWSDCFHLPRPSVSPPPSPAPNPAHSQCTSAPAATLPTSPACSAHLPNPASFSPAPQKLSPATPPPLACPRPSSAPSLFPNARPLPHIVSPDQALSPLPP